MSICFNAKRPRQAYDWQSWTFNWRNNLRMQCEDLPIWKRAEVAKGTTGRRKLSKLHEAEEAEGHRGELQKHSSESGKSSREFEHLDQGEIRQYPRQRCQDGWVERERQEDEKRSQQYAKILWKGRSRLSIDTWYLRSAGAPNSQLHAER